MGGAGNGKYAALCGMICFVVITLHNSLVAVVCLVNPEEEENSPPDLFATSYTTLARAGLSNKTVDFLKRDVTQARNRELMRAQIAARLTRRSRGSSNFQDGVSTCRVILSTILSSMTGCIPPLVPWLPHLSTKDDIHPWDDVSIGIAMSSGISAFCLIIFSLLSTTWRDTLLRFITLSTASGIAYAVGHGCGYMY